MGKIWPSVGLLGVSPCPYPTSRPAGEITQKFGGRGVVEPTLNAIADELVGLMPAVDPVAVLHITAKIPEPPEVLAQIVGAGLEKITTWNSIKIRDFRING